MIPATPALNCVINNQPAARHTGTDLSDSSWLQLAQRDSTRSSSMRSPNALRTYILIRMFIIDGHIVL
jgi:hypothetical protein